jgi:hypothetical protein
MASEAVATKADEVVTWSKARTRQALSRALTVPCRPRTRCRCCSARSELVDTVCAVRAGDDDWTSLVRRFDLMLH